MFPRLAKNNLAYAGLLGAVLISQCLLAYPARGVPLANSPNVILGKDSPAVPYPKKVSPVPRAVETVSASIAPIEIFSPVIGLNVVPMADIGIGRGWFAMKCQGNHPMNKGGFVFPVGVNRHEKVSATTGYRHQKLRFVLGVDARRIRFDAAKIRDGVASGKAFIGYGFPSFFHETIIPRNLYFCEA